VLKNDSKGNVNLDGSSDINTLEISLKIKPVFFVIVKNSGFGLRVHPPIDEVLKNLKGGSLEIDREDQDLNDVSDNK
jgi:hypothetical protein